MNMKILLKVLSTIKWVLISLIGAIIIFAIIIIICRGLNNKKYKITGEAAISENRYIIINEVEQLIQIRGKNINNPLILYLHGGPGNPIPFLTYYFQEYLIDNFTFVSWEQRGSGRTYYRNESDNENVTMEILLQDLNKLIQYLKQRFGKDQIIIMGHSWGTILGVTYIKEYPENVSQYIGIGQCINFNEGKLYSGRKALEIAKEKNNVKDIAELENFWLNVLNILIISP